MCGRFVLYTPGNELADLFGLGRELDTSPCYNISPGRAVLTVRRSKFGSREAAGLVWGLVPSWSRDPNSGPRPINARIESVLHKPYFREGMSARRCLVPADGFYEWRKQGRQKLPFFFRKSDNSTFAIAAIWESWNKPGVPGLESMALLTREADESVSRIHPRMPLIVPPGLYEAWLDCESYPAHEALESVARHPGPVLESYRVSNLVGDTAADGPWCIEPLKESVLEDGLFPGGV
ncbi:MAG: SOS response-associated peptidase [Deltaproteobacteria bacterium]|nr:SOS response-associated peptidase [Deltaproteobacteria bacterium]